MRSSRAKAVDITPKVRGIVYKRDSCEGAPCCIFCGRPDRLTVAHYIGRAHGGLGISENLAVVCMECHHRLDNGDGQALKERFKRYLMAIYPGWNEEKLVFDKWGRLDGTDGKSD